MSKRILKKLLKQKHVSAVPSKFDKEGNPTHYNLYMMQLELEETPGRRV